MYACKFFELISSWCNGKSYIKMNIIIKNTTNDKLLIVRIVIYL